LAVRIRLRRMGRKKRPFYRIVAADARFPRDGRFIEELGYYNPLEDPFKVEVNEERVLYWLQQGAQPTTTVKSLLRKRGIILRFDLMRQGLPAEKIEEEMKKWEVLQLERLKRRAAKRAEAEKEKVSEAPAEEVEEPKEAESAPEQAAEAPSTPEEKPEVKEEPSKEEPSAEAEEAAKADAPESNEAKEETDESSEAEKKE